MITALRATLTRVERAAQTTQNEPKGKKMFIKKSEAEQAPAQQPNLVKMYRAIGSPAIAAAVAALKMRKPKTKKSGKGLKGCRIATRKGEFASVA